MITVEARWIVVKDFSTVLSHWLYRSLLQGATAADLNVLDIPSRLLRFKDLCFFGGRLGDELYAVHIPTVPGVYPFEIRQKLWSDLWKANMWNRCKNRRFVLSIVWAGVFWWWYGLLWYSVITATHIAYDIHFTSNDLCQSLRILCLARWFEGLIRHFHLALPFSLQHHLHSTALFAEFGRLSLHILRTSANQTRAFR